MLSAGAAAVDEGQSIAFSLQTTGLAAGTSLFYSLSGTGVTAADVAGGSLSGMIAGVDAVLARIDVRTRVIPGHGPLADRAALQAYRDMLATAGQRIAALRAGGRSIDAIVAARPIALSSSKSSFKSLTRCSSCSFVSTSCMFFWMTERNRRELSIARARAAAIINRMPPAAS